MIRNLEQISTYYEPASCERCGCATHWGELISCKTYIGGALALAGYNFICPKCYKLAVKVAKTYIELSEV